MKKIKHYIWEISVLEMPLIKKKCTKCNSHDNHFYCSGKFRVNAQKRNIDVWLIYRCTECDSTLNVTILSRTKPELIDSALYHNFLQNDTNTAWRYSLDVETMRRNRLELDYSEIQYDIIQQPVTLDEITSMDAESIEFSIKNPANINLKLSSIIRECLHISLNQLERMIGAGV